VGIALALALAAPLARAEHTRVTNPNAASLEIFGRGLMYAIQYDRVMNDDLAAGLGIGSVGTKDANDKDLGRSAWLIPVHAEYYISRDQGSLFVTAGANLVTNASTVKGSFSTLGGVEFSSTPIQGTFGVGYENRGDSGFLFRAAVYGIVASKLSPWLGVTFGFAQ